jgi:trk system potassium uptake protein
LFASASADGIIIQDNARLEDFIGKFLKDSDLPNRFGIQVIAVKEFIPDRMTFMPKADFVIKGTDILIVISYERNLEKTA